MDSDEAIDRTVHLIRKLSQETWHYIRDIEKGVFTTMCWLEFTPDINVLMIGRIDDITEPLCDACQKTTKVRWEVTLEKSGLKKKEQIRG